MGNINIKKKELKRLKEKVENYRADVEAAKASAHFMLRKYKAHALYPTTFRQNPLIRETKKINLSFYYQCS